jgi:hypothetical protein
MGVMRNLLRGIGQLALWQKLVVGALIALILLTWLGVCLILASYLGP